VEIRTGAEHHFVQPADRTGIALAPSPLKIKIEFPVFRAASATMIVLAAVCLTGALRGNAADSPGRAPALSPAIAASIRAGLPKYDPEVRRAALAKRDENRDDVVRMPQVVVWALKPFSGVDLLDKVGLSKLLHEKYPGASLNGQDPYTSVLPNYAALMYREDRRARQISELERIAAVLGASGDLEGEKKLRKEMQKIFFRHLSWQEEGMDRSANGGRR
jgi:hypothetical protein